MFSLTNCTSTGREAVRRIPPLARIRRYTLRKKRKPVLWGFHSLISLSDFPGEIKNKICSINRPPTPFPQASSLPSGPGPPSPGCMYFVFSVPKGACRARVWWGGAAAPVGACPLWWLAGPQWAVPPAPSWPARAVFCFVVVGVGEVTSRE